jgi:hypothetical protein
MEDNKAARFSSILSAVWKMLSTRDKKIYILIDLFNEIKKKRKSNQNKNFNYLPNASREGNSRRTR